MVQGKLENKCQMCKGTIVTTDNGEICCSKCGYVMVETTYDMGFDYDAPREGIGGRVGPPTNQVMYDKSLYTVMDKSNKDSSGKPIIGLQKSTMQRLRTWDSRTMSSNPTSRNFVKAFSELESLCDKMAIPDNVKERAAGVYRTAVDRRLIRGRTIQTLIAASLYIAIMENELPRSLKDVQEKACVNLKDISANYRMLVQELDLKLPIVSSIAFVSKIATFCTIDMTQKVTQTAIKIIKEAQTNFHSHGKDPVGMAAAALYASGIIHNVDGLTQRKIAEAAHVTEVTIRNRYSGMLKMLRKLYPHEMHAIEDEKKKKKMKNEIAANKVKYDEYKEKRKLQETRS